MIRVRRPFVLVGRVPPSKSWLNRALILRSLHPDLRIFEWEPSELDGDDVTFLSNALAQLATGEKEFYIGESGTGLRFLLARLACEQGVFKIRGSATLLGRPHSVLIEALKTLGTTVTSVDEDTLEVSAQGWPDQPVTIEIDGSESSQFASALLLASSRSSHTLTLKLTGVPRSTGYFAMTEAMVRLVKAGRKALAAETDASSVAALAVIAVACAHEMRRKALQRLASQTMAEDDVQLSQTLQTLRDLVEKTLQPDRVVFDILEKISADGEIHAIDVELGEAPDLFPILASLSVFAGVRARARGDSQVRTRTKIFGAPHLRFKESDRIREMARLLKTVGVSYQERDDGIEVDGLTPQQEAEFVRLREQGLAFQFDPAGDHRMAFAAAVLAAGGIPIEVSNRGVVSKSLPMFWSMIEGDAPRIAMIGHRGSGKTEAAKRWSHWLGVRSVLIDLDREIERLAGKSALEIFEALGEGEFRWFEKRAWREIDIETRNSLGTVIAAAGAGFDPSIIDDSWTRVWLRRATDHGGRIFTDRPRLDPKVDPLTESRERTRQREPGFRNHADRIFEMPEGAETGRLQDSGERAWVADLLDSDIEGTAPIAGLGGSVTLRPEHRLSETIPRLLRWGTARIEVRDDLWSSRNESAAWKFFASIPHDRILLSFRDPSNTDATLGHLRMWLKTRDSGDNHSRTGDPIEVDWPCDRAPNIPDEIRTWAQSGHITLIASFHGTATSYGGTAPSAADTSSSISVDRLEEFEKSVQIDAVVKAALVVENYATLRKFHEWMMRSPRTRVFLPMTPPPPASERLSPRWQWYRAWIGAGAAHGLNFWREDDGSSLDQPTFSQWWRRRRFSSRPIGCDFAAVLGDPVLHSRTPIEHDAFFQTYGYPVFAIPMARKDVTDGLPLLVEMGLKAAAVTAPLKEEIEKDAVVNTIVVKDQARSEILTTSTDGVGFEKLWREAKELCGRLGLPLSADGSGVVVWGGGGVLPSIQKTLPAAAYFSASKGEARRPANGDVNMASSMTEAPPDVVIWASGESRGAWPPSKTGVPPASKRVWHPKVIVDLSYTENSMGRQIALETGARYISGLSMFEAQAEAQRQFWSEHLPKDEPAK